MDPFEDVRSAASELLRIAPRACFLDWESKGDLEVGLLPHIAFLGARIEREHRNYLANGEGDNGRTTSQETFCNLLKCFTEHAEDAATRTGRADLADGVSRANELLCRLMINDRPRCSLLNGLITDLESRIARAEHNLAEAVLTAPIHGQFASVRLFLLQISIPWLANVFEG